MDNRESSAALSGASLALRRDVRLCAGERVHHQGAEVLACTDTPHGARGNRPRSCAPCTEELAGGHCWRSWRALCLPPPPRRSLLASAPAALFPVHAGEIKPRGQACGADALVLRLRLPDSVQPTALGDLAHSEFTLVVKLKVRGDRHVSMGGLPCARCCWQLESKVGRSAVAVRCCCRCAHLLQATPYVTAAPSLELPLVVFQVRDHHGHRARRAHPGTCSGWLTLRNARMLCARSPRSTWPCTPAQISPSGTAR